MKKSASFIYAFFYLLISFFITSGLISCNKKTDEHAPSVIQNSRKISAYTGGVVSQSETIKVVFSEIPEKTGAEASGFLKLKPAVQGKISWENDWTLIFTPLKPFKAETKYQANLDLAKLFEDETEDFVFKFETAVPLLEVNLDALKIDINGMAVISGRVIADQSVSVTNLEKTVTSKALGKPLWTHAGETHQFVFNPVKRKGMEQTININWDGKSIGSKNKGNLLIQIPQTDRFEVLDIKQPSANTLEVTFSSPLKQNQDLRGFIDFSGSGDIRYSIDENIAKIFFNTIPAAGSQISIRDLADINGEKLYKPVNYTISEKWEYPEVRFAGQGEILPTSQGAVIVLETRNITGVIVEAFEIYGDNIVQFLQVNNLDGTRELERVGEPVWSKSFDLPWTGMDKNRWVRHGLDLSELSAKHPDSLFRIRVTFRKRHVNYECTNTHADFSELEFPGDSLPPIIPGDYETDSSYWNYSESYYNKRNTYDWRRYKKDPCHPAFYESYYDHDITKGRNILVSDLGLSAKKTASGEWLVIANDLKTAKPAANTELSFLNYQGRVIEVLKTDSDGSITKKLSSPPAFIFAKNSSSRAFLKLADSLSLATSHFDISGDKPASGIKGFIYGERGVWRPGDNIYLTFLLSDPQNTLPTNHPVTFEMEDPQGRIVETKTFTASLNGFYPIPTSTKSNSPTGDWTARVKVGGNTFLKNLKIETVMPNRLKIDLDSGDKPYLDTSLTKMILKAAWLHGAPAPFLDADVSATFADKETTFPTYTDYNFRDPSRYVSQERHMLFEGELDENSEAVFNVELSPGESVPGKLSAKFFTRVFEPSGIFSSEQVTMEFSPYNRYVGIKLPKGDAARDMLLTDTDHTTEIIVLDADGKPVKESVELECAIYKLNWRWWWEKGAEESADFTNAISRTPVMRGTVKTSGGKAKWNFRVNYPSWGRYLILVRDVSGGHAAANITYIDWPGWAGRAQDGQQGASAMLSLTADKNSYKPGEPVSISFPSNNEAMAYAVVEKGGEVIHKQWIECKDNSTTFTFQAEPAMAPNIYVHIMLLQKHLQTVNDLPIRLYGIIPVTVNDPKTEITPVIKAPESWEPETDVSFSISESGGRAMTYTVAVVDEGLLGLTRYKTLNPRSVFYRKEASFLKSWDLYSRIIGAFSGKLETLLAIGGGDDEIDATEKKAERFKPVAMYFGPFYLKEGETQTHKFAMPQYVGAVRVMVVGSSEPATANTKNSLAVSGKAYGIAEKTVTVKSDLMVLSTLPRILSPDDEVVIPVSVFSYQEGKRSVSVKLDISGSLKLAQNQPNQLTVDFDKAGDKIVEFKAAAGSLPGAAKVNVTASSKNLKDAKSETEIEIRSSAIPVTAAALELVSGGKSWKKTLLLPGRDGSNIASIELSRMPPIALESRLEFLIRYPHGCLEQTTSGVFPQLYLDRILTLTENELTDIRNNIDVGIEKLSGFQTYNGGLAYWPGNPEPNEWATTYAGHFLIEARRAGYSVPAGLLDNWKSYQKKKAADWSGTNAQDMLNQAYRLYTLALAGEPDIGSMNRLLERGSLPPSVQWRLAAAYWHAGQRDTARSIAKEAPLAVDNYRELSGTFGSTFRDKAMILETLALISDESRAKTLLEDISETLSSEKWLSTQETAYALIAIMPFTQGRENAGPIVVDIQLNGEKQSATFRSQTILLDLGNITGTKGDFSLTNRSELPVYARVITKGLPEEGAEIALSQGLALEVIYTDMEGNEINPFTLPPGEDLDVSVTVTNTENKIVSEIALIHLIPAGWEIINTRLGDEEGSYNPAFNYQDIRDDRVMTYFDLKAGQSKTVTFRVNATYSGNYFMPAIHAYAMYDESIRALIPGQKQTGK